jgi:hypothetical protein
LFFSKFLNNDNNLSLVNEGIFCNEIDCSLHVFDSKKMKKFLKYEIFELFSCIFFINGFDVNNKINSFKSYKLLSDKSIDCIFDKFDNIKKIIFNSVFSFINPSINIYYYL